MAPPTTYAETGYGNSPAAIDARGLRDQAQLTGMMIYHVVLAVPVAAVVSLLVALVFVFALDRTAPADTDAFRARLAGQMERLGPSSPGPRARQAAEQASKPDRRAVQTKPATPVAPAPPITTAPAPTPPSTGGAAVPESPAAGEGPRHEAAPGSVPGSSGFDGSG